jgi:cysteine desulfurase
VPNIVGLGKACALANEYISRPAIRELRDQLEDQILARFPFAQINGTADREKRLPNTLSVSFRGFEGREILESLDEAGICVSTGSACTSESDAVSAVLQGMKVPLEAARGSIRFSLGRYNTSAEIDETLGELTRILR